ncbi:MAG: DUF2442 domain-containing protein [Proteobacteria bacterium]|nr:DUF2442 domain-containing protein [Pseudomonadota bacterium]
MSSDVRGTITSEVEVTNVSVHGFWLLLPDGERFVPFAEFPWFRDAPIGKLVNVTLASADHLYWPDLDIDLAVESIDHPDRFPLVSKAGH